MNFRKVHTVFQMDYGLLFTKLRSQNGLKPTERQSQRREVSLPTHGYTSAAFIHFSKNRNQLVIVWKRAESLSRHQTQFILKITFRECSVPEHVFRTEQSRYPRISERWRNKNIQLNE